MEYVKITSLKKGDLVLDNPINFKNQKGKFGVGKVEAFKVMFNTSCLINEQLDDIEVRDDCAIIFENGDDMIAKLDKKDLIEFEKLKLKIRMLKELK